MPRMTSPDDRVYSRADLKTWRFDGTPLAVLGHPIAHSLSPAMHNAALAAMAATEPRLRTWRYFKFDVPPDELAGALPEFFERGFAGLNLTIPHKVLAVDLVRAIDPAAAEAGAVNTLRRLRDGGFEGFNTDGYGIVLALKEDLGAELAGAAVILLGAGGAARGAAIACLREGCAALWIGNRTAGNLESLLEQLRSTAAAAETSAGVAATLVRGFDLSSLPDDLPADAIVINATSAGLKSDDAAPIDLRRLPGEPRVYDMIYNPPATPLLRDAAALGRPGANGLSMLVHQGARALEIWTGRPVPAAVMHEACLAALRRPPAASK